MRMCVWERCRYSLRISFLPFSETLINQQVPDYQGHLSLAAASLHNCRGSPHTCSSSCCPLLHQVNRGFEVVRQRQILPFPPPHCKGKNLFPFDIHFSAAHNIPAHSPLPERHHTFTVSQLLRRIECILIIFKQLKNIQ